MSSGSFLEFFGNRLVLGEDSKVEKVEALGEELVSLRVLECTEVSDWNCSRGF